MSRPNRSELSGIDVDDELEPEVNGDHRRGEVESRARLLEEALLYNERASLDRLPPFSCSKKSPTKSKKKAQIKMMAATGRRSSAASNAVDNDVIEQQSGEGGSVQTMACKSCETPGCGREAKLQCPTCIKLGLNTKTSSVGGNSFFCSQECFRGYWPVHKSVHKTANSCASTASGAGHTESNCNITDAANSNGGGGDRHAGEYRPWPTYAFTGKLRPYPVTKSRTVSASIARPDYATDLEGRPAGELELRRSTCIRVLDDQEIDGMRVAGRLGREVLDVALDAIQVGVTTEEIDRLVHEACVDRECYPSPLNYYCFPKSCCTSVNEVICHGIPDRRPLADGDICNVDVSVYHRGFHGDLNETVCVGNVDDDGKNLVRVAYECLSHAIDVVKPGTKYRDVGTLIQKHAQMHGFSVVRSYCGHGIHRLFHTAPSVPHYSKNKAVGIMKAGHTFTIEPMISEGTWRDEIWPDNWTAVTQDGKRSAQFEHTLLVTESGCEILTRRNNRDGQPYFMD